jgi:S-formylglutathione hydrolase FrmB
MALLRCDFASEVLKMDASMTVILPQDLRTPFSPEPAPISTAPPVLYLLHGLGDDASAWSRQTAIERYVAPLGLAVVMPQVGRSFYADQVHGQPYWTFLSEELPVLVDAMFRVSTRREDTFVAGLSMGGFGAMKWALRDPERFAAVASISGVLDSAQVRRNREPHREAVMEAAFGEGDIGGTDNDVRHLLVEAADGGRPMPAMYICCGEQDALHHSNVQFARLATDLGVPLTAEFGPGGHDWAYFDAGIRRVLSWLPLGPGR